MSTTHPKLTISVHQDGWTRGMQFSIETAQSGTRLSGPKFNGSSKVIALLEVDSESATVIRGYLDREFPNMKTDDSDLEVGHAMSGPSAGVQSTEWLDKPTGPGWWWYTDIDVFNPEPREVIKTQNGLHLQGSNSYGWFHGRRFDGKWSPITPPTPPQ